MAMVVCVALLLVALHFKSKAGEWIFKNLASALFVLCAWIGGATEDSFGTWILIGLVFCWAGDALLIPDGDSWFMAGLSAFLLAHVAFAVAFFDAYQSGYAIALLIALIVSAVIAVIVIRWLAQYVPEKMRWPVFAYIVVIAVMVALAWSTVWSVRESVIAASILFALSDLFVARQAFVRPSMHNQRIGLPLYFGAQILFATSVY